VNEPTGGTLENRRIAAQWQIHDGHLTGLVIHNKSVEESGTGFTVRLEGPFAIGLKEMGVFAGNQGDDSRCGEGRASDAEPGCVTLCGATASIAVHYRLDDPAGQFQADWARFLRQTPVTFARC